MLTYQRCTPYTHPASAKPHERTFCMVVAEGPGAKSENMQMVGAVTSEKGKVRTAELIAQAQYYAMHGGDY